MGKTELSPKLLKKWKSGEMRKVTNLEISVKPDGKDYFIITVKSTIKGIGVHLISESKMSYGDTFNIIPTDDFKIKQRFIVE
jgi:hypothetical protein